MAKREIIAVYGGSFDPPTRCHGIVSAEVLSSGVCDKVWIMPCGDDRPDKEQRTPALLRLKMCQLQIDDQFGSTDQIVVSDFECGKPYLSTVHLMREMHSAHPDKVFRMIIGSDLIAQLKSWTAASELLREVHFLIVPRGGFQTETTETGKECNCSISKLIASEAIPPEHWTCINCALMRSKQWKLVCTNGSSTESRLRLRAGANRENLSSLLCQKVLGLVVLDTQGKRLAVRYAAAAPSAPLGSFPKQSAFEGRLTQRAQKLLQRHTEEDTVEVMLMEELMVLFKCLGDINVFVIAEPHENELMMTEVMTGLTMAITLVCNNQVTKNSIIDNLSDVFIILDEIVDNRIIFETNPTIIAARVQMTERIASEASEPNAFNQALQSAKENLFKSILRSF